MSKRLSIISALILAGFALLTAAVHRADETTPETTYSGTKTITDLTFQFGNWTGFPDGKDNKPEDFQVLTIKPSYLPGLQIGDAVKITFEAAGGQAQYIYRNSNNTEWVKAGSNEADKGGYWDIESKGPYTFEVTTDEQVNSIIEYGLFVDANGSPKVTKVEFVYNNHAEEVPDLKADKPDPTPEYTETLVWEGSQPVGKWTDQATVPASTFAHFTKVTEIKVEVSSISNDAQYQLRYGADGNANLTDADAVGFNAGPIKYTVNAGTEANLKKYGLIVKGQYYTVNKIYIIGETDGTEIPVGPGEEEEILPAYMTRTANVLWEKGKGTTDEKYSQVTFKGQSTDEIVFGSDWTTAYPVNASSPDYTDAVHIPAEMFTTVNLDDKMVVTFANFQGEGKSEGRFCFIDTDKKGFTRGTGNADNVSDYFTISSARQTRLVVNYRGAGALRNNGLWIDGKNAEIVKIELIHYDNTSLSNEDDATYPRFLGDPKQNVDQEQAGYTQERGYNVVQDNADYDPTLTSTPRRLRPRAFTNYRNGERIRFVFEKTGDDPWFRINFVRPNSSSMRVSQGLTGTDEGICTKFTETEEGLVAEYVPTQREIRALKVNGLFLDGSNLKLKEIIFGLSKIEGDIRAQDLWIHNDWVTLGHNDGKNYEGDVWYSGDVEIYVSYTHFQRAIADNWLPEGVSDYKGYRLTFHFPWAGNGANFQLYYDSERTFDSNRDPLNQFYAAAYPDQAQKVTRRADDDAIEATPESGAYHEGEMTIGDPGNNDKKNVYVDFPLDSDNVTKMSKYGFWMKGANADFQSVKLRSPMTVSGIESVSEEAAENLTVDFTQPYEAYTLDGRRVANADAPGLYIVRQGNMVQKILVR